MLKEKIDQVLKTLTYREREIIKLRYGLGDGYTYTLEEVGRIFKVTRERVRQIEAKAVRKLQHPGPKPAARGVPREYRLTPARRPPAAPRATGGFLLDRPPDRDRDEPDRVCRRIGLIRDGSSESSRADGRPPTASRPTDRTPMEPDHRCPPPPRTSATCTSSTSAPRPCATA